MPIYHSNLPGLKLTIQVCMCVCMLLVHSHIHTHTHTHTHTNNTWLPLNYILPMSTELLLLHCHAVMKPEAIKLSIAITLLHPNCQHLQRVYIMCLTCLCYSPSVTSLPCSTKATTCKCPRATLVLCVTECIWVPCKKFVFQPIQSHRPSLRCTLT